MAYFALFKRAFVISMLPFIVYAYLKCVSWLWATLYNANEETFYSYV